MEKAYKYRIYPNKKQRGLIGKTFGCCRFVYNTYLAKRKEAYEQKKETISYVQCANDMKKLKSEEEWLKEVDSTAVDIKPLEKTGKSVGIDLGIKEFCVMSNGGMVPNPKYLKKSIDKLAKLQRSLSRKSNGSSNRNKARIKVARLQKHIAEQRKDFLNKLSTK